METSIASSPSIGKKEVFNSIYESNVHFDWGLEGCAMEMEVDNEEGAMDIVVSEPRSKQEGDTSTFGSHVGPATNPTPTPTLYDYTEHFTTDKVFSSKKELVEWTRSTSKRYNFVIIIKASEKFIKNRKPRMRFSCERSRKYRKFVKKSLGEVVAVKKKAARSTGTKKIEFPFLLKGVKGNDGWTVSVHNGTHNHPPMVYLEGHSYPGRLSTEQTAMLVDLSVSLVKPKQILTFINEDCNKHEWKQLIFFGVPQKGSPMPPIACNWTIYRDSIAKNWDVPYVKAIQKFKEIIGNDVATKKVINVD
ncbi:hypothetical protein RHMOL_Rhmol09G0081600 [Rhododendron molle]|uniref:Uncharacterized protein n=1 Tax=Rhododendron molle TaxID=49168 RepID=A0ACC0MB46_RHOML|nr:hypothetical protein RHMOL_Rhmol09G0081600 [Rhododendron molle]